MKIISKTVISTKMKAGKQQPREEFTTRSDESEKCGIRRLTKYKVKWSCEMSLAFFVFSLPLISLSISFSLSSLPFHNNKDIDNNNNNRRRIRRILFRLFVLIIIIIMIIIIKV